MTDRTEQLNGQTNQKKGKQAITIGKQANRLANKQTDKHSYKQLNEQTIDSQADR